MLVTCILEFCGAGLEVGARRMLLSRTWGAGCSAWRGPPVQEASQWDAEHTTLAPPAARACVCPALRVSLFFQNPSNVPRGEEPPGLSGAAQGEVGGECLRSGRAPLFHGPGPARPAPREVASCPCGNPAEAAGDLSGPGSVSRRSHQVGTRFGKHLLGRLLPGL